MHPAFSIIFFSSASGAGFGMLGLSGLFVLLGLGDVGLGPMLAIAILGFALSVAGLVSSAGHLGRPERAWRAFSQWRTSWLSREGVAAPVALGLAALLFIACAFGSPTGVLARLLGLVTLLACGGTVVCTAMIYASLKPVPRWHNSWVLPAYLAFSAASGALFLMAVGHLFDAGWRIVDALAVIAVLAAFLVKEGYWRRGFSAYGASSVESATGLGRLGRTVPFEAPHTEENFLLSEMGYRVGRKHAGKLRTIARLCAFVVPLLFTLLILILPGGGIAAGFFAILAVVVASAGILVERWLFFAEAKHVVSLYYPQARAATA